MVQQRKVTQLKKLEEDDDDTFALDIEDFNDVIDRFKKKTTRTFDFLTKSGEKNTKLQCKTVQTNHRYRRCPNIFPKHHTLQDLEDEGGYEYS